MQFGQQAGRVDTIDAGCLADGVKLADVAAYTQHAPPDENLGHAGRLGHKFINCCVERYHFFGVFRVRMFVRLIRFERSLMNLTNLTNFVNLMNLLGGALGLDLGLAREVDGVGQNAR